MEQNKLIVIQSSNIVEDMCTVNGLCHILDTNDIPYTVMNKQPLGYFEITHDPINYKDLIFCDITFDDTRTCNSTLNKKNKEKIVSALNDFFNNYSYEIFMYYSTGLEKYISNFGTGNALSIGTFFNSRGIRGTSSVRPLGVNLLKRYITFLGWIFSVNYIANDNTEVNALIIPENANRILKPWEFTYKDKTTGETKVRRIWGKSSNKTNSMLSAEIYTNTIREYLVYRENSQKNESNYNIKCIVFMLFKKGGRKPMPQNFFSIPRYNTWNKEIYIKFSKLLNMSIVDIDVKNILATYILAPSLNNFRKLIKIFSSKNQMLEITLEKGLVEMYSNRIQMIHNNDSVKKLGRALGELIRNSSGFNILAKLYNTRTVSEMSSRIREIEDEFFRMRQKNASKYKYALADNEHIEIINLLETDNDALACVDAVISYARIYFHPKKPDNTLALDSLPKNEKIPKKVS